MSSWVGHNHRSIDNLQNPPTIDHRIATPGHQPTLSKICQIGQHTHWTARKRTKTDVCVLLSPSQKEEEEEEEEEENREKKTLVSYKKNKKTLLTDAPSPPPLVPNNFAILTLAESADRFVLAHLN